MTRDRHDDLFDTASLEFEFDDPHRASEVPRPAEHSAETVELSAAALRVPGERREANPRVFVALLAGAAAIAVVAVIVVGAIRGDDSPSPTSAPPADAQPAAPASPASPAETPAAAPAASLEPVAQEDEGPAVRRLQEALAELGFDPGDIDGVYGEATVAAVADFQESAGLEADGIAGPATIEALNAALGRG